MSKNGSKENIGKNQIDSLDDWFNELESFDNSAELQKQDSFVNSDLRTGPAVGIAELNTLADLFEGEAPDLEDNWEVQEVAKAGESEWKNSLNWSDAEDYDSGDLTDILFGEDEDYPPKKAQIEEADLSSLFEEEIETIPRNKESSKNGGLKELENSDRQDSSSEYLANLFGGFELEEEELAVSEVTLDADDSSEDLVSLLGEFPEVEIDDRETANIIENQEAEVEESKS